MKKNKKTNVYLVILLYLTVLYLKNSSFITEQILSYTKLFIEKLFPASFLFFTLSALLIEYNIIPFLTKFFHHNGATFYVVSMSLISGFPSGSKYTKELLEKKFITETTANYLIRFTHFPNPVFILGPVSLLFPSKKYTYAILFSVILANIIISFFKKPKEKEELPLPINKNPSLAKTLPIAITNSIKTILLIYGTSIFFYLIITIINHYINLPILEYVIINGIFDLTNGIFLTSLITHPIQRALIIIFFISLGGISVHMQTKSIITDTNIKYRNFFIGRILQTFFASILFLWIINW